MVRYACQRHVSSLSSCNVSFLCGAAFEKERREIKFKKKKWKRNVTAESSGDATPTTKLLASTLSFSYSHVCSSLFFSAGLIRPCDFLFTPLNL